MNEKHEFQVGDLVRLKSVEEILALGFWFNEQGGVSYPNSKVVLLLSDELQYCGKEFVVKDIVDITAHNHITLDSPNSSVRIVNICPSVLELVEVEEEDEETTFKSGDRVRIKQVDELLELGYTIDAYGDLRYPNNCVFLNKYQMRYCGREFTVVDHEVAGIYVIESLDRKTLFDFVLESAMELIEDEDEDWISKPDLKVKPGDKVRIKTHEELLASGWELEDDGYYYVGEDSLSDIEIVVDMKSYLGEVCTIKAIIHMCDNYTEFRLEEDGGWFYWTSRMVAEMVTDVEVATFEDKYCQDSEVDTYRDEEGEPFNPNSDYIEEEYQPYCAVVDEIKNNPTEWVTCNQTQTKWEDECKTTTWDKDRIQRGFENLEMYVKGYDDGFQRALDLMKKEFGVE